jgi:hypothetical protein
MAIAFAPAAATTALMQSPNQLAIFEKLQRQSRTLGNHGIAERVRPLLAAKEALELSGLRHPRPALFQM